MKFADRGIAPGKDPLLVSPLRADARGGKKFVSLDKGDAAPSAAGGREVASDRDFSQLQKQKRAPGR